jgi:hypothetical protein
MGAVHVTGAFTVEMQTFLYLIELLYHMEQDSDHTYVMSEVRAIGMMNSVWTDRNVTL